MEREREPACHSDKDKRALGRTRLPERAYWPSTRARDVLVHAGGKRGIAPLCDGHARDTHPSSVSTRARRTGRIGAFAGTATARDHFTFCTRILYIRLCHR